MIGRAFSCWGYFRLGLGPDPSLLVLVVVFEGGRNLKTPDGDGFHDQIDLKFTMYLKLVTPSNNHFFDSLYEK